MTQPQMHGFSGDLLTPASIGYDGARRVWNGLIDRRPAIIARCHSTTDVISALQYGRQHALAIAIRGGGHSMRGHSVCNDGLVIDLSLMNKVAVDVAHKTAIVQGGCLLRDVDRVLAPFGLAVPAGVVSHTGVGGLTLGGGIGHLTRKFGLTIDSLRAAHIVTADGRLVTASEHTNPELFWAVRGGGGNFGVVIDFTFALHEVRSIVTALAVHRMDRGPELLARMSAAMIDAPDDFSWSCFARVAPPFPWIPASLVGQPTMLSALEWCGDPAVGTKYIDNLINGLHADAQNTATVPYVDWQCVFDSAVPHGSLAYCKAGFFTDLPAAALDLFTECGRLVPTAQSQLELIPVGGEAARINPQSTAYPHRHCSWSVNALGLCTSPDEVSKTVRWVKETYDRLQPFMSGGVYLNFMGGDEPGGSKSAFGATFPRLQAVKRAFDPDNIFSHNQNILPAHP